MNGFAQQSDVRLVIEIENDISLNADPNKLLQVLTNLISNAIKYSEPNNLVTVKAEPTETGMVRFSVTDQGAGIPLEYQHKLFEKYQQVDSSDTRAKEGSGLGLSICKAIVLQHGGKIGLISKPGFGTTFWFDLQSIEIINESEELPLSDGKKLVLIVENDLPLARRLGQRLNKQGFSTKHVTSKDQAMSLLSKSLPDVVLTDLQLQDESGIDLIEGIRADTRMSTIPIIVMTEKHVNELNFAPPVVFDWFCKPLDLTLLMTSIERATNDKHEHKILVVEQDINTRAVIVALLKPLNATCIEACTGIQAISVARSSHPDVIVLDVNIPQYNGFNIVESLKKDSSLSIPLVVYSAEEFTESERRKLTLGATKHLTKGRVTSEEFIEAVRESLDTAIASSIQLILSSH